MSQSVVFPHQIAQKIREQLKQELVRLIKQTYLSTIPNQPMNATIHIKNILQENDFMRFDLLEQMLQQCLILQDKNLCKAIANVAVVMGQQFYKQILSMSNVKSFCSYAPENLLRKLQHFFDNNNIPLQYKSQLSKIFVTLSNTIYGKIQKFIGKIKYLFDIRQYSKALMLFRAFILNANIQKDYDLFYQNLGNIFVVCFLKIVQKLQQKIQENDYLNLASEFLWTLALQLQNWPQKRNQITYCHFLFSQQFQALLKLLIELIHKRSWEKNVLKIVGKLARTHHMLPGNIRKDQIINTLSRVEDQIYQKIIRSLTSSTQATQFQFQNRLTFLTDSLCLKAKGQKQSNYQELATIYLSTVYSLIQEYLSKIGGNQTEVYSFFQDASFQMNSECSQVAFNKYFHCLCKEFKEINDILVNFLLQFYIQYVPNNLPNAKKCQKQLLSLKDNNKSQQSWNGGKQMLGYNTKVALTITALQTKILILSKDFLFVLQDFMNKNGALLLQSQDQLMPFFVFLVYENYSSQIWFGPDSNEFQTAITEYALNHPQPFGFFMLTTLRDKLSEGIPLVFVTQQISVIKQHILQAFRRQILPVLAMILKKYTGPLQQQQTINIMDLVVNQLKIDLHASLKGSTDFLGDYLQIFQQFFGLEAYKNYIGIYLGHLQRIILTFSAKLMWNLDMFLHLIALGLRKTKCLPLQYSALLQSMAITLTDTEAMEAVNLMILYCDFNDSAQFLNQVALRLTEYKLESLESLLIMHNLIRKYCGRLKQDTINQIILQTIMNLIFKEEEFNFVNGKHNLTLLLLLNKDIDRFVEATQVVTVDLIEHKLQQNCMYKTTDWSYSQLTHDISKIKMAIEMKLGFDQNGRNFKVSQITQRIFNFIYKCPSFYRVEYDISCFIELQIDTFKENYNHPLISKYACTSFMTILTCLQTAIKSANSPQFKLCQNSATFRSQREQEYEKCMMILQRYTLVESWKKIDQCRLVNSFINFLVQNKELEQWYQVMKNACISEDRRPQLSAYLSNRKVEGQFRKIHKIKKDLAQSQNKSE